MANLVSPPENATTGFVRGAIATFSAVGLPIIGIMAVRAWDVAGWGTIAFTVPLALVMSVLGGVLCAVWRLIQGWAYDRFTQGSDFGQD